MEIHNIKLQSSLGRMQHFYRQDMDMNGFMALARVLKVHHKSGTADIALVNSKDTYSSSSVNEGKFAARIVQNTANFDEKRQRYWGTVDPIAEGSLVLVAFMENMKQRPIILGAFHRPDNVDNPFTNLYPLKEKNEGLHRREALKKLRINPALTYQKIDGEGNIEVTFGSKSFFAMYNTNMDPMGHLADNHGGFDHADLTEIDKRTGTPLEADWEESKAPARFLFVKRNFDNTDGWTKFFLDEFGMFRITRDNNDGKLSYFELNEDGSMKFRQQQDEVLHGEGEKFSELGMTATGEPYLKHHSGSIITFDGEDIIIRAKGKVIQEEGAE